MTTSDVTPTTPSVSDDPQRAAAIANIRAFADWLEANPDVPEPDMFEASCLQTGIEQALSVRLVLGVADRHAGAKETSNGLGWVTVVPPAAPLCKYVLYTARERRGDEPEGWA
jgi:hypothetical protein